MADEIISVPEVADSGRVLDQEFNEWVNGFQRCFRRQRIIKIFDNQPFDGGGGTTFSNAFYLAPYSQFSLYAKQVLIANSLITLNIRIEASLDGSEWYYFSDLAGTNISWIQNDVRDFRIWPLRDYRPLYWVRFRIITTGGANAKVNLSMSLFCDSDAPR